MEFKDIFQFRLLNLYSDLDKCEELILIALSDLRTETNKSHRRVLEKKIRIEKRDRKLLMIEILRLQGVTKKYT